MKNLKAFGFALILFIIFVWIILVVTTKFVIPMKLDIGKSIKTPDIVNLELSVAKQKLREAGFSFQDSLAIIWVTSPKYPDRTVISQIPKANKIVKNTNRIKMEVSTGGKQVVIPLVLEENAINASSRLKQLGLDVKFVKKSYGLYDQNTVVKVEPGVGTKVLKGSQVTLFIESEIEDVVTERDSLGLSTDPLIDNVKTKTDDSTLEEILNNN